MICSKTVLTSFGQSLTHLRVVRLRSATDFSTAVHRPDLQTASQPSGDDRREQEHPAQRSNSPDRRLSCNSVKNAEFTAELQPKGQPRFASEQSVSTLHAREDSSKCVNRFTTSSQRSRKIGLTTIGPETVSSLTKAPSECVFPLTQSPPISRLSASIIPAAITAPMSRAETTRIMLGHPVSGSWSCQPTAASDAAARDPV